MTQITPRLERAIDEGELARFKKKCGLDYRDVTPDQAYAQAFIADLLLPDPPAPADPGAEVITLGASFDYGFAAYERMIKARAGLVQEGVDV